MPSEEGRIIGRGCEEQKQCLAVAVAGRDPADSEVLLLVTEAALHDSCAQVADDPAGCRDMLAECRRFFVTSQ